MARILTVLEVGAVVVVHCTTISHLIYWQHLFPMKMFVRRCIFTAPSDGTLQPRPDICLLEVLGPHGGLSGKAQQVQEDSRRKGIQGSTSREEIKCICLNARSIINKKDELNIMVDDIKPHIIGITETWANNDITDAELGLEGYAMFRKDRMGRRGGGVLLYIKENIPAYEVQLQEEADCNEAIWCKLVTGHTTVTIGVVYRCPNITKQNNEKIYNAISEVSKGDCIIMGDFNHGNIKWDSLQSTGVEDQRFLCLVQDNFLTQHVLEPTRAARVLDIVLSSQKEFVDNVVIQEPLGSSDHNQLHFNINIKSDKTKVKQCRRDFRKGNYKKIRKSLALIDWNEKMKNKTATECWNILRGELDSAIDSYVPMKKQGKRSKKKNLSKEAFRKIRCKQNMWRVYKHTGKDKDYDAYKEALNTATNEVRKSNAVGRRARLQYPPHPLGWGGYRFLKQIWQPWSVVRGHVRSCAVVRAWPVMRGHARSVVRGRSCAVVRGRAVVPFCPLRGQHCRGTNEQTNERTTSNNPLNPPGVGWVNFFYFFKVTVSIRTCVPNLGSFRRPCRKFYLSNL